MMKIPQKKGVVKIGVGAGFIVTMVVLLFLVSSLLTPTAAPADLSGSIIDEISGGNPNKPILIDVTKIGEDNDNGDEESDETGESEEEDDEDDSGSGFVPMLGGGGGPVIQCHYKVCDYDQQACVEVQGSGEDECETFDDCIYTECDYDEEVCLTIESPGDDECDSDEDCYCDPKTPGYWKNHLSEAGGLLDCVHDNYDVFDDVENQSDITHVLECSGNCSNMWNKLKKFLLATILNVCADYFDLDDAYSGETIEYWIDQSIAEVENGESEMDEYYKDALDAILNDEIECNPERHTLCNYDDMTCDSVLGSGENECVTFDDCFHDICDYDYLTCESRPISEPGDSCETDEDCYHMECIGME